MHQVVLVDVVVVTVEVVLAGCVVAPKTMRPVVMVVVDDLPVVVADQVLVVQRVQVPAVPALVAECRCPNLRHPGHTEYY